MIKAIKRLLNTAADPASEPAHLEGSELRDLYIHNQANEAQKEIYRRFLAQRNIEIRDCLKNESDSS